MTRTFVTGWRDALTNRIIVSMDDNTAVSIAKTLDKKKHHDHKAVASVLKSMTKPS